MSVPSHEEAQKRVADPMFQLEHSVQDSKKGNEEAPQVHQLQVSQLLDLVRLIQLLLGGHRCYRNRRRMTLPSTSC